MSAIRETRERELDRIVAALDGAADGGGRAVVIEGPAGLGKTRSSPSSALASAQPCTGTRLARCPTPDRVVISQE